MEMERKVLFVDDEPEVINALRRDFRRSPYQTFFALSGKEGLEILDRERVDLVVADMKMPQMDGSEFLRRVKASHPEVICVILSGYTESHEVYDALAKGLAKAYFTKPWEREVLHEYLDNIFRLKEQLEDKKLLEVVNSVPNLPTLPERHQRILDLIAGDEDLGKIAGLIEEDPSLTAAVLRLANSAFYAQRKPVTSVKRAVVVLGMNVLKDVVLSLGILDSFVRMGGDRGGVEELWEHAIICNRMVNYLYESLFHERLPEEFSVVGLLHDVGKMFMVTCLSERFREITKVVKDDPGKDWLEAEREVLGISHSSLGAYLLNWWNFPYPIIEAVMYHHEPVASGIMSPEVTALVHIADFYSHSMSKCRPSSPLKDEAFAIVNVKAEEIEAKIERFFRDHYKFRKSVKKAKDGTATGCHGLVRRR